MLGDPGLFFRDKDIEILKFTRRKDQYREEVSDREETGGSTGGGWGGGGSKQVLGGTVGQGKHSTIYRK